MTYIGGGPVKGSGLYISCCNDKLFTRDIDYKYGHSDDHLLSKAINKLILKKGYVRKYTFAFTFY